MNSKEAVELMRDINNRINNAVEIELKLIAYNDYTSSSTSRKVIYKKRISDLKKETKEIYKMFKDGCGEKWRMWNGDTEEYDEFGKCRHDILCLKCLKIKKIHDAVHVKDGGSK